jgi:hypothetical protein
VAKRKNPGLAAAGEAMQPFLTMAEYLIENTGLAGSDMDPTTLAIGMVAGAASAQYAPQWTARKYRELIVFLAHGGKNPPETLESELRTMVNAMTAVRRRPLGGQR